MFHIGLGVVLGLFIGAFIPSVLRKIKALFVKYFGSAVKKVEEKL